MDKFFKELFTNANNEQLKDFAAKAVILVNNIKDYSNSTNVDFITAIVPGDWDNELVYKVRKVLPIVIETVSMIGGCASQPTLGGKVVCMVNLIKVKEENERTKFWHGLAASIGVALSDGKLTVSDLFLVLEPIFREITKKKQQTKVL